MLRDDYIVFRQEVNMTKFKTNRQQSKFMPTVSTKFTKAPQRNIPDKILKKLHLRSMVHR